MSLQRWHLVVTLGAAATTAALGQTAAPGFGPAGGGSQTHGFELPLSGPGPVTNRSRRPDGAGNLLQLVGDYTNPILKPQASRS